MIHTHITKFNDFLSHDKVDRTNEILKYGQPFSIQCVEDKEELVLYSVQKSADLSTMIAPSYDCHDRGEINLPVGLCLKKVCKSIYKKNARII